MAGPTFSGPMFFFFTLVATAISPSHAFGLTPRDSSACPASYQQCAISGLSTSFCCPSSSTCISLDNESSAMCCPSGQSCAYIAPITCDIKQQNATLYPTNPIHTTKLGDSLPTCGDACCPFGYTCQGNSTCALNTATSSTATSLASSGTTLTSTSATPNPTITSSTTSSATSTASDTSDTSSTTASAEPTITSSSTPIISTISNSALSSTSAEATTACSSFPTKALLAGFFPGAVFGAVVALLVMVCSKRRRNDQPPSGKLAQYNKRSSKGAFINISDPIPLEDNTLRTDFLLRKDQKRNSEGARSMLQRTGTRVKSFFGSKPNNMASKLPPLPLILPQQVQIQQAPPVRQNSTESIRVYTPPSVFAQRGVLKPEPYPTMNMRPETTFADMIDQVGFKNSQGDPCYQVADGLPNPSSKGPLRLQRKV